MHARTVANPVDVAGGSEVRSDNGLIWVLRGWCEADRACTNCPRSMRPK